MSTFVHRFVPGAAPGTAPLLLLHGTGGNEDDLIPLAQEIAPGRSLLSPRGQVREGGMPRWFRRLAEGVFDFADVQARTDELAAFIDEARERYGIAAPIAVGFSNGANIAAALLIRRPGLLAGAVLMRAMPPLPDLTARLSGEPVLMLTGALDPIVAAAAAERLATALRDGGADLSNEVLPAGHGLTQADLEAARRFLAAH